MKRLDPEANKVACVEGENLTDAMHIHERDEPRIMHFHAADGMGGNEALPFFVSGRRIRQKRENRFDFGVIVESSRKSTLRVCLRSDMCFRYRSPSFFRLAASAVAWLNRWRGMLINANRGLVARRLRKAGGRRRGIIYAMRRK
jgi:hypothetical protein